MCFLGPPGPPGGLRIEDIKDTSVTLTWSRGTDNHSPISKYTIQSKTFLSEEWKDAKTGKGSIRTNKINRLTFDSSYMCLILYIPYWTTNNM